MQKEVFYLFSYYLQMCECLYILVYRFYFESLEDLCNLLIKNLDYSKKIIFFNKKVVLYKLFYKQMFVYLMGNFSV